MPHDVMNTIHETGMSDSYHWLFWAVVVAVFALLIFYIWRFGISQEKRSRKSSGDKSLESGDHKEREKGEREDE